MIDFDDVEAFQRDGYLMKRNVFTSNEMSILNDAFEHDSALRRRLFGLDYGLGNTNEIAMWNHPGDDSFGAIARGERLVRASEDLLGDEVYHYHSKITSKRPGSGGTWVWHQDFGYWYKNGCLFPDMLSVAIPLNPMSEVNGCLQVLKGSHKMGRLEHGFVGSQTGAHPHRVSAACSRMDTVAFDALPGDVMFFHSNTLQTSAPNHSLIHRNLLVIAYNTRSNDPIYEHHHPRYSRIEVLPDSAILDRAFHYDGENRVFMDPADDKTIASFEEMT